jgi:hypothetical protein
MPDNEFDQQVERLKSYLNYSKVNQTGMLPTAEHIAIEQALALAYIARELSRKS